MIHQRGASLSLWSATDTTVGKCALVGVIALGSAALSNLTVLDGTAIKMVLNAQITANTIFTPMCPIPFNSLVFDMTGTASYVAIYYPTP